jgi:hypothetical protein
MKSIINKLLLLFAVTLFLTSCHKDLDQSPIDPDSFTEEDVFANATEAKGALAKLYASLALTGQNGPAGQADIADIDEGFSQYTRMLFNLNELTTDHAVVGWGDAGLQDLHGMYWASGNDFTDAMYYRLAQEVTFCNSFIANAAALNSDPEVQYYIAEARFLRAFAYYNLMDLYANVPLVTELTTVLPAQSNRAEIFAFVEAELLAIKDIMKESGANEYGRVDRVAAWALLSKLYINAETWIGTAKYTECITYSNLVMTSTYNLNLNDANGNGTAYDELFLADNDSNGAQDEFIFALNFDGLRSQTYGGSTFLIHAAIGGSMNAAQFGVNGGWGGLRTTKNLVNQFAVDLGAMNAALGTQSDWGLVGSATPNGWGSGDDIEMYQTATNQYALYVDLLSGEMKFRFAEDWGNNYGDDGANGTLEAGGSNIAIGAAGTYYVTMNLNNNTYTVTPFLSDKRGMFYSAGQNLEITDIAQFNNGYAVSKFKNVTSTGAQGSDSSGNFTDTDIPVIRLAEIYLNYAEAVLRGGTGGNLTTAVAKINELRVRAYGSTSGNVATISLNFILDERSKELYWEGQRRTDLIRFGKFTTADYLWPFKGNAPTGAAVASYRNIFPLPPNAISVNTNLVQNTGY